MDDFIKIFPRLRRPLFEQWSFAVRFEINRTDRGIYRDGRTDYNQEYFDQVLQNVERIYTEVFSPNDRIIVVIQQIKERCLQRLTLPAWILDYTDIKNRQIKGLYQDKDVFCEYFIQMQAKALDYKKLFLQIANSDFVDRVPRLPKMINDVFLINIDKEIVFFMYDDRGIDLIGNDKNYLKQVADKFKNLVIKEKQSS